MRRANGDHRCLQGIDVARHHRLQSHDQAAHDDHGVDCLVRSCGMTAFALNFDVASI